MTTDIAIPVLAGVYGLLIGSFLNVCALRCVTTEDFMTADWYRMCHKLMAKISSRITNEVAGINRVVYDVTSKPPATVEWE